MVVLKTWAQINLAHSARILNQKFWKFVDTKSNIFSIKISKKFRPRNLEKIEISKMPPKIFRPKKNEIRKSWIFLKSEISIFRKFSNFQKFDFFRFSIFLVALAHMAWICFSKVARGR